MRSGKAIKTALLLGGFLLSACAGKQTPASSSYDDSRPESVGSVEEYDVSYYDNDRYNDYVHDGNSALENQWERYGLSSPYILRHNGVYYLYASTNPNGNLSGVRAWKSADLVHWNKVPGLPSSPGYVVAHTVGATLSARAPEVYYYDGAFYMFESYAGGKGHFVLRSDSPEGPFLALTNAAIDSAYDGTLVFDEDENPYFLTAMKDSINVSTMESISSIIETETPVRGTDEYPGLFAESPSVFERMGKYYLLYSSGYSATDGYQINYAVSDGWEDKTPSGLASSFRKGAATRLMLNADARQGFVGLGHPSVVLGPDLDSHYLAYDGIDSISQGRFSMNIDRLFADGDLLSSAHNRFASVSPRLPASQAYFSSQFEQAGDFLLLEGVSEEAFSAEYNFRNGQSSQLVFSYVSPEDYAYLSVDMGSSFSLHKVEQGKDTLLKEMEFYHYFSNADLHTFRIAYRDKKLDIRFENSLKLFDFDIELHPGRVGYKAGAGLGVEYTCFSNVARGLSDEREVKPADLVTPALAFPDDGFFADASSSLLRGESGPSLRAKASYSGVRELRFSYPYDYVRYLAHFPQDGRYSLELVLDAENRGKTFIAEIDDGEDLEMRIPEFEANPGDVIRVRIGDFDVEKGLHQVKIQSGLDPVSFIAYRFVKEASRGYGLNLSLANERQVRGLWFGSDSQWEFNEGKMVSNDNTRNIALTEENCLSDFSMAVEFTLTGSSSIFAESKQAGLLFRANNYVSYRDYLSGFSDLAMWNARFYSVQGYYLAFTSRKADLYRLDGDANHYSLLASIDADIGSRTKREALVQVRGNDIHVFLDGEHLLSATDPLAFSSGGVGLFTSGAEVRYENLRVQSAR